MIPMLAVDGCLEDIGRITDYFCQPKLNGVRGIVNPEDGLLYTRSESSLGSVDHIVEELKAVGLNRVPLDGEIYVHGVSFQIINGLACRDNSSPETGVLEFHIFDVAIDGMSTDDRIKFISGIKESAHIKVVKTELPGTVLEATLLYNHYLAQGYEGIILRKKTGEYVHDKTQNLLRIKPSMDTEAELIGFAPCMDERSKNSKTFGSLILRLDNGIVFKCSGIKAGDRKNLWAKKPLGARVTFKHNGFFDNGKPVFPRFSHIRWDLKEVA